MIGTSDYGGKNFWKKPKVKRVIYSEDKEERDKPGLCTLPDYLHGHRYIS